MKKWLNAHIPTQFFKMKKTLFKAHTVTSLDTREHGTPPLRRLVMAVEQYSQPT